jgi:D-alanyl-D-alanine carboxypeptidase (penicillin-binding protein 5/6)
VAGLSVLSAGAILVPHGLGWGESPHRSVLHSISIEWPAQGQAAISVAGLGHRSSPAIEPVPIASVAKVMTAYVVLRHDPLSANGSGFTMTFNDADAELADADRADGQSYLPVTAGETMTEREALTALLLPSANNIADALADHVAGSVSQFVHDMNHAAIGLGMSDTDYTDPSGFDASTISSAPDQLRLARAAMAIPAFAEIVGLPTATLPGAGLVRNTDQLLGQDGFVGIKTGSDQAAGGCFMFEAVRRVGGHQRRVIGVVLGQTRGPLIAAGLQAAQSLVDHVMTQLAHKT